MRSTINTLALERGILTSSYKEEIKRNVRRMHSQSLSKVKRRIKKDSSKLCSEAGTILKVSMFATALIMIVF